ncbi:MAG: tetratricopeptide repeat protein [Trueperaceae bacterium]|nr:tetratricopeptide repeat protein [Trueperaceae bacterium]
MAMATQSPWRKVFEEVRQIIGNKRDTDGVLGSINWLRKQMMLKGANPNVVRNIIYRDKGKIADKRALYETLKELWQRYSDVPLQVPELEVLFSSNLNTEQEIAQLLGREKRRAYSSFVSSVRSGKFPKLLVTGRPGSGKTLLLDYIQQALELPPKVTKSVMRFEFSSDDLVASLSKMAFALGITEDSFEAKLVKLGTSGAYAVQADAQADVARLIIDAIRSYTEPIVIMIQLSQSLTDLTHLANSALRLNQPDVPRVNAAEWLWLSLIEPLSKMSQVGLLVSLVSLPARAHTHMSAFEEPVKLNPPTTIEARRFVKLRLPKLSAHQQESIVQRAGRSYEELRTLTLLAEIREASPGETLSENEEHVKQLSQLYKNAGDHRLRNFLAALAVMSLPEYPSFAKEALQAVRGQELSYLNNLEQAFLDPIPGQEEVYRCFSRQLARQLRQEFEQEEPELYRELNLKAATYYEQAAKQQPSSNEAARYLYHLFEARDWLTLETWLRQWSMPQSLLRRLWQVALEELKEGAVFEAIARQVASHFVRLGSFNHPDAVKAFEVLSHSSDPDIRSWTLLKRAEGAVLKGQIELATALLQSWPNSTDPILEAEYKLVEASIERWRSNLQAAAELVKKGAKPLLRTISNKDTAGRLIHAKAAVWAGLIAKDQGQLEEALEEFLAGHSSDDLIEARLTFQIGDIQMKLGRFDGALKALDQAVSRSYRSEALIQEQTRYLARRGTLHRKQGKFNDAQDDFQAALTVLQREDASIKGLERDFWLAKLKDEYALFLLAKGSFDKAIFTLRDNQQVFERYQKENKVDASYRLLRSSLRLALAYGCRATQQPFMRPLERSVNTVISPEDANHAQELVTGIIAQIEKRTDQKTHYLELYRQGVMLASWLSSNPKKALSFAEKANTLARFPYQSAETLTHLAFAHYHAGNYQEVISFSHEASKALAKTTSRMEKGDLALHAWILGLEQKALLAQGDLEGAVKSLRRSLVAELEPYHLNLLRGFGNVAEKKIPWAAKHEALKPLLSTEPGTLRLADALVSSWQKSRSPEAEILFF